MKEVFGLLEVESGIGGEVVRIKRAEAVEAIVTSFGKGNWGTFQAGREEVKMSFREGIGSGLSGERSGAVKEILERARGILEL